MRATCHAKLPGIAPGCAKRRPNEYFTVIRTLIDRGTWPGHRYWLDWLARLPSVWMEHQHTLAEIKSFAAWVDVCNAFIQANAFVVHPAETMAGASVTERERGELNKILEELETARMAMVVLALTRRERRGTRADDG